MDNTMQNQKIDDFFDQLNPFKEFHYLKKETI